MTKACKTCQQGYDEQYLDDEGNCVDCHRELRQLAELYRELHANDNTKQDTGTDDNPTS